MTYCVVCFINENLVEAVPYHWYFDKKCAWPKNQNAKKFIENKTKPNSLEFNWFSARLLSKEEISSLEEARYKAKLATCTSDLSASEETKESRKYRHKKDDDTSEEEMIIKTKKRKISQEPSKNMPKLPILHSDSECSDKMIEDESYIPYPSSPSPKKKFEKKINDSVISNEVPYPEASVDLRESMNWEISDNTNKNDITSTPSIEWTALNINDKSNHSKKSGSVRVLPVTLDTILEIQNKILMEMLYIKHSIGQIMLNIQQLQIDKQPDSIPCLRKSLELTSEVYPLKTDCDLHSFELKLLSEDFSFKVIEELKHFTQNNLGDTVRKMLSVLFTNDVLSQYSYVGQKKKKSFKELKSCRLIFDAIRSINKYINTPDIAIEQPLKIYLAGAKFRDMTKKKKNSN